MTIVDTDVHTHGEPQQASPKIAANSLDKRHINQRQSLRSLMTILMHLDMGSLNLF